MFANNEMEYDEQTVLSDLSLIFDGAVKALRGGLMYRLYKKSELNFSLVWIMPMLFYLV